MNYKDLIDRYESQKGSAKTRGVAWEITFEEWCKVWHKSGKWEERGRGSDKYCMARRNDTGPYSLRNVYITTCGGNTRDFHSWNTTQYTDRAPTGRYMSMKADMREAMEEARNNRLRVVTDYYSQGYPIKEIAEMMEVSRQRIHQLLKEAGAK